MSSSSGIKWKECRNCGRSFKVGKGVNSKGKKFTPVGIVVGICTLGYTLVSPVCSLQKYCSRECWRADTRQ